MRLYFLIFITLILGSSTFFGCKEPVDGTVISGISDSTSYSGTGCRGRNSGIKDGPSTLRLPYPNGDSYTVSQTWFGDFSHNSIGREHALDFPMTTNDDIYPVMAGKVIAVKEDSNVNCTSNCPYANYVMVDHGSGYIGRYLHFCHECVDVNPGDDISGDTRLGGAGNTGWSSGTHLHFELVDWEENCSVRYGFDENSNSYDPLVVNSSYTSTNPSGQAYVTSTITGNAFKNVGVTLTSTIPWYVSASDSLTIQGSLTTAALAEGNNAVVVFLVDENFDVVESPVTKQFESTAGSFDFTYTVPAVSAGTYYLCISKSKSELSSYWFENPPYLIVH